MKKLPYYIVLVISFGIVLFSFKSSVKIEAKEILHDMFDSIRNVKTLRLTIHAIEREKANYITVTSEVKLQINPRRLYFINREKKIEILYDQNKNKALVKTHLMPNLNLDPTGSLMRKNQHYTINELGFESIAKSISLTIYKDKEGLKNFVYKGKCKKMNYNCYLIQYENSGYSFTEYIVGNKETATSISSKLMINDYLLRYKNGLLNDFGYLKTGSKLMVPTLYCKKAILFIDEKLCLPIAVSLYDNEGLFESYEYQSVILNSTIKEEEFNKDFKGYGFN